LYKGRARVLAFSVLEPNSEGMKRLTWALAAASTRRSWVAMALEATVEIRASWPVRAAVRDEREE